MNEPKAAAVHGGVDVGVVQDHQRGLAAQLQHHRLEVLGAGLGNDLAHLGGAGEVHAAHGRVGHHGLHHGASVGRGVGDVVHHAGREACFLQGLDDQAVGARAQLRALEDHGVAAGQRGGDGAHRQDHRGVPGRDAQHHAGGLAHSHGQAAGHVGGNHLARDLRGQRGRFLQHAGGQVHVEAGPDGRCPGLLRHGLGEGLGLGFQCLGRLQQQATALARAHGGPGWEGLASGVCGGHCIGHGGGGGRGGHAAVQRVLPREGGAIGGGHRFAVDQQGNRMHCRPSLFGKGRHGRPCRWRGGASRPRQKRHGSARRRQRLQPLCQKNGHKNP